MQASTAAAVILGSTAGGDSLSVWQVIAVFAATPILLFAVISVIVVLTTEPDHQPEGVRKATAQRSGAETGATDNSSAGGSAAGPAPPGDRPER